MILCDRDAPPLRPPTYAFFGMLFAELLGRILFDILVHDLDNQGVARREELGYHTANAMRSPARVGPPRSVRRVGRGWDGL